MKYTKKELEGAILLIADEIGVRGGFEGLIGAYQGTPKIVEMIVYEMFLNDINESTVLEQSNPDLDLVEACNIVLSFAKELRERGFVIYGETWQ